MAVEIVSSVTDFSAGEIHGISDIRRKIKHARIIENGILEPLGGVGVRLGSQRLTNQTLTKKPHTIMEWVAANGSSKCFIVAEDTTGLLSEVTAGALTAQTTPYGLHPSAKGVWEQQNGAEFLTQFQGGSNPPFFFRSTNPANKWHTGILPRPAFPFIPLGTPISGGGIPGGTTVAVTVNAGDTTLAMSAPANATGNITLTVGSGTTQFLIPNVQTTNLNANLRYQSAGAAAGLQMTLGVAAGGNVPVGAQPWYRLRFLYLDGSSRSNAPLQLGAPIAGPNQTVAITNIANEIRSDYIGWILERTNVGGTVNGPFYFVAQGNGVVTVYNDTAADADLGYRADENLHGEPPHFDGIMAYRDVLVGWVGSNIWFSQPVAGPEGTGICNWPALQSTPAGPDDGDTISIVLKQADRLCILKRWSVWIAEGDDFASLRVFDIYKGAGAGGCRAACAVGQTIYFHGDAGFHRIVGNDVKPFGYTEEGDTFKAFRAGQNGDVKVVNYLNQWVLVFFSTGANYNDDGLMYDLRFGGWTRIKGWYVADAVVQKAGNFGDARTMLTVDRRDLDSGAGFDYPIWLSFYGFLDEKSATGTGGTPPTWVLETPMIDDGRPGNDKEWQRIQGFLSGTNISASVTLNFDPQQSASVTLTAAQSGTLWGAPATWAAFTWATATDAGPYIGLPPQSRGRRYSLRIVVQPIADLAFKGYEMVGKLKLSKDYSRS